MRVRIVLCLMFLAFVVTGYSQQQRLTLQQCIDLSLENNLTLKRQENTVRQNEWITWQSRMAFLPTLNGFANYTSNVGTVFNQVSFSREANTTTSFSSPSLNAQLNLFDGFGRYNSLKQNQLALEASQYGLERQKNTLLTQVLQAYLNVVIDKSNVVITERRIELLKQQEARQQKLYEGGTSVEADVLSITSQLAVEELNLIQAKNLLERDKLTLLQLVIPASQWGNTSYDFEVVDTSLITVDYRTVAIPSLSEVEQTALQELPDLKEQQLLIQSNDYAIKVAKSSYYPTLNFNAGLSSNYSSSPIIIDSTVRVPFTVFDSPDLSDQSVTQLGYFNGSTVVGEDQIGYFNQLGDNFNYSYGVSINVPILNGGQVRQAVENAKIARANAQLTYEETQNGLITAIRQAYLDLLAARQRIESLDRQLLATKRAYQNAEARFNEGLVDYYAYFEALNNQSRLEAEQVQSRYEFFFRKKVIDFYMGRELTFDR